MGAESNANDPAGGNVVTPGDTGDQGAQGNETPNQEAARYRVRAKDAETERDRLAGVVERLQRSIVDRVAEEAGIKPDALWASGVEVADLLVDAEDGDDATDLIDHAKVGDAVTEAMNRFGISAAPRRPAPNPLQGQQQDETATDDDFVGAFQPPGGNP